MFRAQASSRMDSAAKASSLLPESWPVLTNSLTIQPPKCCVWSAKKIRNIQVERSTLWKRVRSISSQGYQRIHTPLRSSLSLASMKWHKESDPMANQCSISERAGEEFSVVVSLPPRVEDWEEPPASARSTNELDLIKGTTRKCEE